MSEQPSGQWEQEPIILDHIILKNEGKETKGYLSDVSYSREQDLTLEQRKRVFNNLKLGVPFPQDENGEEKDGEIRLVSEDYLAKELSSKVSTEFENQKIEKQALDRAAYVAKQSAKDVAREVYSESDFGQVALSGTSQGRSAKYGFTTPGWKRILNIIRVSNG